MAEPTAWMANGASAEDLPLYRQIVDLVAGCRGDVGVCAQLHGTSRSLSVAGDEPFPTASAIKIFVSAALYHAAFRGEVDLRERVRLREEGRTLGSGVLLDLDTGLEPTLRDLAVLMHALSDNHATNLLIERLGTETINEFISAQGLSTTRLGGPIDFERLREDKCALGVSTPHEMVRFLTAAQARAVHGDHATQQWWGLLAMQKYIEPLRRHLPVDPYAREFGEPERAQVASKTGSLAGVRVEVGVVTAGERSWSLAVMTKALVDQRATSDNEGVRLIASISRAVFEHWAE